MSKISKSNRRKGNPYSKTANEKTLLRAKMREKGVLLTKLILKSKLKESSNE